MKLKVATITAAAMLAGAWTASAAAIISGEFDPNATMQGATRLLRLGGLESFTDVYLANTPAELQFGPRSEMDASWNQGSSGNNFEFEWNPGTDLITTRIDTTPADAIGVQTLSRSFADPAANLLPNYLRIYTLDTKENNVLTMTLTDLDGNLLGSAFNPLVGTEPGSYLSIIDPFLLQNGFVLKGNVKWTGNPDSGQRDTFDIAFGHSNLVPEPSAGALLLLPFGISTLRRMRKA